MDRGTIRHELWSKMREERHLTRQIEDESYEKLTGEEFQYMRSVIVIEALETDNPTAKAIAEKLNRVELVDKGDRVLVVEELEVVF